MSARCSFAFAIKETALLIFVVLSWLTNIWAKANRRAEGEDHSLLIITFFKILEIFIYLILLTRHGSNGLTYRVNTSHHYKVMFTM